MLEPFSSRCSPKFEMWRVRHEARYRHAFRRFAQECADRCGGVVISGIAEVVIEALFASSRIRTSFLSSTCYGAFQCRGSGELQLAGSGPFGQSKGSA